MDRDRTRLRHEAISEAYREFAPFVRTQLSRLGVRDADLPDQCHEVFAVLHRRSDRYDEIERVDLWLREVCRRAAAGYRRRSGHKLEVLKAPFELSSAGELSPSAEPDASLERRDDADRVRSALERLDDESRDLLALHDVGEMPLTELAKLVEHDRKTVRKRLEAARHRLSVLMTQEGAAPASKPSRAPEISDAAPDTVKSAVGFEPRSFDRQPALGADPMAPGELQVASLTPGLTIGLIGNVVVAIWSGAVELASIETLATVGPKLIAQSGGKISYLAVVETVVRPPPLAARQRIVSALDEMGPHVLGYATVMLGKGTWIVRPIMSGLLVLSRPRFPMRFFDAIPSAASWLCASYARSAGGGAMSVPALCAAAERLRLLRA